MNNLMAVTPPGHPDAAIAIAASRAGAIGVLDLQFCTDTSAATAALARLVGLGRGRLGALVDAGDDGLAALLELPLGGLDTILLAGGAEDRLGADVGMLRRRGLRPFVVATGIGQARAAAAAGADAVVAKGHEAGGWVGDDGTFVLLQQCVAELALPVWAHGGIGLHTAAACRVAGAAGAVLDAQLLLTRESPLGGAARDLIGAMDGSETICLGPAPAARLRIHARPGQAHVEALRALECPADGDERAWRAAARDRVDWRDGGGGALAVGQDAAFAADLARRFSTVGGVLTAVAAAAKSQCRSARNAAPLDAGSPLAASHGTRYPIVQGPMTRVSDRAEFTVAVAEAGALPFLALALMRGADSAALLEETKRLAGERPWGVGVLGFVPAELRTEQLEAIRTHRPPFALIAGGRPDQARELEDQGIATYLHVPSPALLELYLADGARRFVFEGRECGGHVGPRTSFVLWDTMVRVLLDALPQRAEDCHVLFAGGVHDARSAAMVAAVAAPLAERGVRVGVLVGTAYLFTEEAVRHGAITERFQQAAVAGESTVLLESGPGHATRCLPSPFAAEFAAERRRLRHEGAPAEEQRRRLEELNIGRLRIASKGRDRDAGAAPDPTAPALVPVEPGEQWERGMYMIGQVAAMHRDVDTLADLHADLATGGSALLEALPEPAEAAEPAPAPADVAIIGIGSILPGAPELRTFWANILGKVDAIEEIPPNRWDWRAYFDADRATPDRIYSRWGGFVDDVEFDPVAFGMPPNSLRSIEPFQLLGLLTARAALSDAGYAERPFARDRASVILGAGGGGADLAVGYTVRSALPKLFGDGAGAIGAALGDRLPEWTEDSFPGLLMNVAAGRIANRLDFGGSNFTVDAACASSLAAIGLAVRELQTRTSDIAIAGGVDAIQNPFAYLCFAKTQALSPNGRCRPFDAAADGIAISEGFAAVVLKRLADAERDGDRIYAVIRGVGSASDGRDRSLTAPRPEGQMRALRRAYAHAGFSPATVGLIEAHGTGTVAGDRAEVEALAAVFDEAGAGRQACAVGSVKSMIGHTKATAGVAGLIKAALALHHKVLPPTLGVTEPNPKAGFPSSPFFVNTEPRPWVHAADHPRRAAVSAFGFGGTNSHIALEEYTGAFLPEREAAVDPWPAELLLFRGATREEIVAATDALEAKLAAGAEPALADLAAALAAAAEPAGPERRTLAVVADSLDDLRDKLRMALGQLTGERGTVHLPNGIHYAERPLAHDGRVAFLFPGQGSQSIDMAREVSLAFPEVRESFERADRVLAGRYEKPLSRYVFPPSPFGRDEERARQAELTATNVAQPALGATDLGYRHLLAALGVEPELAAGHSYGEFVALAAAGSLSEDDLLRLSEARGRFIREGAGDESGAMAAVDAGPDTLGPLLADGELVFANLNAPEQTVVSGSRAAVERALAWCSEHDLVARRLPVACAFHSRFVEPAQQRLADELRRTPIAPPRIPVFSNTTAAVYSDDPAEIAALLGEHLVRPVEFVRQIEAMHDAGARVFVEAGPRSVLTGLVDHILGDRPHVAVSVDQPGCPGLVALLRCLAGLAAEGVAIDTSRLFRGRALTRLRLADLEPAGGRPDRSVATWLVNGGRARPAAEPLTPTPPVALEGLMTHSGNGASANGHHERLPAPSTAAEPLPLTAAASERAGDVMGRFQQVMQQFLETESNVMLAYLGTPRAATAIAPAPAATPPPAPAPAVEVAAVAAASPAPPPARPQTNGQVAAAEVRVILLEVVSDRTGYPQEMLDLDADMEADLGIDSIKRVEIAGTMMQRLELPEHVEVDVEQITASRTLSEVIAVLELAAGAGGDGEEQRLPFDAAPADGRIGRFVLDTAGAPAVIADAGLAATGTVLIVDDGTGVGERLAERLGERGHVAVRIASADVTGADAVAALVARHGAAKALVHLAPLAGGTELDVLFLLARGLAADLVAAGGAGGAAVLGATRMGGTFGVGDAADALDPRHGSVAGLIKTLAHEWSGVRAKAVDVGAVATEAVADLLLDELLAADGLVEVGYRDGRRMALELVPAPTAGRADTAPLDAGAVVLVTGGARGITAEVALELAERRPLTLVLVGRTQPAKEDPEIAAIMEERDLKRAVFERLRVSAGDVNAALVEEEFRRIAHGREVRANLARLRAAGATVHYRVCDVRDGAALTALVEQVYAEHGRIDGVVHGAGVIEDKLVADKQLASFERVLATKAGSAQALAAALRPETLRFLVFFGSVSGRFGNRGQADYAAASEVLGKLAQDLDRRWDARVVSINWGPWQTAGMVTPEVQRQFAERGVALIDVATGRRRFEEELRLGRKGEAEVVIGGLTDAPAQPAAPAAPLLAAATAVTRGDGGAEVVRTLDPAHDLYLADHCLDGTPVFPFAGAMELMAETAAAARPELEVTALRRIRVLQGIKLDDGPRTVRVTAVAAAATTLDVRVDPLDGDGRGHFGASVELADALPAPEIAHLPLPGLAAFPMAIEDAYAAHLFHGPLFQGIAAIEGMDERGASALLEPSDPAACLRDLPAGGRSGWILDPVLIDCALQMQVLWARRHWDVTLLPAQIDGYARFAAPRAGQAVRHELRILPASRSPMCLADHWFYGPGGELVAQLTGVQGVGSRALNRLASVST